MTSEVLIGNTSVGHGRPIYIVGEIGINHNGSVEIAKKLIKAAHDAGMDAVKFQKRTPELCVPKEQRDRMRNTPWGYISYMDYRHKVEFGVSEYEEINEYCEDLGIAWFASSWDIPSLKFMEYFSPPAHKISSAMLTDRSLLIEAKATERPIILSTGMSTMEEIHTAVSTIGTENLILCHTTSSYPCAPEELNLNMIQKLREYYSCPVGYSGHEVGLIPSAIAVALGACLVERHITLDRSMWGSDQSASIEPHGLQKLVKYIRVTEKALGDGVKKIYDSELPSREKLRKH